MTTSLDEMMTAPVQQAKTTPRWLIVCTVVVLGMAAGIAGALLTHLAFPAKNGAVGPRGKQGIAGVAGATGPAGADGKGATVDTGKIGICWTGEWNQSGFGPKLLTANSKIYAPTLSGGALSCPRGTFISMTPVGADGNPVSNYDVSK